MRAALVVYATRNGSTREVAEAVAHRMRTSGATVECRDARGVRGPVDDVDLVVVGGPLYSGRWHRDARRFLKQHRYELTAVAVFAMGPRTDTTEGWVRARLQLDQALAKLPWLSPTSVTVFGGVDPPATHAGRDLRDWDTIDRWAARLVAGDDPAG